MFKRFKLFFVIFLITISCQDKSEDNQKYYGKIENGIYYNDFFEFSVELQDDMTVIHGLELKELLNINAQENIEDYKKLEKELKRNEQKVKELIALYKNPFDSYGFNPNVIIIAENIKEFDSNIKNGRDFLGYSRFAMENINPNLETLVGFDKRKIGGRQFWELNAFLQTEFGEIQQSYYATIIKDYSLLIIVSYLESTDKLLLEKAIDKLKFRELK